MNRLHREKSPYLLQHADQPVDWYPWGNEALDRARAENQLIFISIGYSTCHWCHVMAHESFDDQQVADLLNRNYVAIKVDREERPDIDAVYMNACRLLNGHCGWPLNLFLTPEGKPFHAMTYAPRLGRGQQPGFIDILIRINELWQQRGDELTAAGEQLAQAVRKMEYPTDPTDLDVRILSAAATTYQQLYDADYGGFGQAPKFPQPHNLTLLLRLGQRLSKPILQDMALTTLTAIDRGGITDQLGGGIHRYSVDQQWLVPHFEKMLYDQALVAEAYLDAWQLDHQPSFRSATEKTLDYLLRELQSSEGGFFCGEDADSEGEEGLFYLWSMTELQKILNPDEMTLFTDLYSLSEQGNFCGKNILARRDNQAQGKGRYRDSTELLHDRWAAIRDKLLRIRDRRPHPHLDDKILSGWNGLAVAALARAGFLFERSDYLHAARRAVDFIVNRLFREGRLLRRFRDGEAAIEAFHEDYAFLIHGLIELFLADFNHEDLQLALALMATCDELFTDHQSGYYNTTIELPGLGRGRDREDGAIPAASSVTAYNLVRLGRLTGRNELEQQARTLLQRHLNQAKDYPTAFAFFLQALDLTLREPLQLILVPAQGRLEPEWKQLLKDFRPQLQTIIRPADSDLEDAIPATAGKNSLDGKTTAWLCTGSGCLPPIADPAELALILEDYAPLNTFNR